MPSTGRHRGPPPTPPRRPTVAPVLGVLLVGCCVAVLVGAASAGRVGGPRGPVSPSVLASAPSPWVAVVTGLDARRAAAFADGSPAELGTVYATGSPAGARDAAALRSLVAAGGTAHGVRPRVRSVSAISPAGTIPADATGRVVLAVVDELPPAIVVDASGRSTVRPGRGERRWRLTLVRTAGQWRIEDVAAA